MDITHLHLHVRDRERAVRFYREWFGLSLLRSGAEISFLAGSQQFLLALMDDPDPTPMPAWFHFGVRMPHAGAVRDLLHRMERAQVPIAKALYEDETLASYRCRDPDGHAIEVYWER